MPTLHNIPIGFNNQAFIVVSQEETHYQNGNIQEDLGLSDCLSFKELSNFATDCNYKCLPVIAQCLYENGTDHQMPRCHTGLDHSCMSKRLVSSRTSRITLNGLLRRKITIMLKIKKFSKPF